MNLSEEILLYAFRYALGRMTYAVGIVSDTIITHWDEINPILQAIIHKEIREAINSLHAGMAMDIECWNKVLKLSRKGKK